MNKKLLTLAVAAAMAAPGLASAEAIMYGKMNVSLDYVNVENVIPSVYNNSAFSPFTIPGVGTVTPSRSCSNGSSTGGCDIFVGPSGQISSFTVTPGTQLTAAQADALRGYLRLAPGQAVGGQDFNGWDLAQSSNYLRQAFAPGAGPSNRFGIKGSEDLGNGLKAIYQVEVGVNFDTNNNLTNNNDTFYWRNTFVGLAGDWGTLLMGRHDTPLKISTGKLDLFADTLADMNATIGFQDLRADSAVAYISPSWSGFQLSAAIVPAGGATATGAQNINSDQINGAYSLAGIYKNGPFYGSLAYESINEEMYMSSAPTAFNSSLNGCYANVADVGVGFGTVTSFNCGQVKDSFNKWRVGLGLLDWNGFSLTGIYENQDNIPTSDQSVIFSDPRLAGLSYNLPGGPDSRELWQVQAGYSFGNFMLKAMYGQTTFSGDPSIGNLSNFGQTTGNMAVYRNILDDYYNGSTDSWAIGADYNFSKRTSAYILYTATTSDQGDLPTLSNSVTGGTGAGGVTVPLTYSKTAWEWDGFSIGMMHSF
jgi:predicted porin